MKGDRSGWSWSRSDRALTVVAGVLVVHLVTNAPSVPTICFGLTPHLLAVGVPAACGAVLLVRLQPWRRSRSVADFLTSRSGVVFSLLALYGVVLLASVVVADRKLNALRLVVAWFESLGAAMLVAVVLGSGRHLRTVALMTTATVLLITAPAVVQHLTGTYGMRWAGLAQVDANTIDGARRRLAGGPVGDGNKYGQWLVVLLPIVLVHVRRGQPKVVRALAAVTGALAVLAVLYTQSRGAWLGLVAALGLVGWRYLRRGQFAACVVGGGLAFLAGPPQWRRQLERIGEVRALFGSHATDDPSSAAHASSILAGLRMFRQHPFLGVGTGNFAHHYRAISADLGIDKINRPLPGDNTVIQLLSETGIVGAVVFLGTMAVVGFTLWTTCRRGPAVLRRSLQDDPDDYRRELAFACGAGLVGYGVCAMFINAFRPETFLLVIAIGLACAPREDAQRRVPDRSPTEKRSSGAPLV